MHIANCSGATKKPRFLVHSFFFLFPFSFNHSSSHPSTPSLLLLQHHRERPANVTILPLLGDVIAVSLSASRRDPHTSTVTAAIFFLTRRRDTPRQGGILRRLSRLHVLLLIELAVGRAGGLKTLLSRSSVLLGDCEKKDKCAEEGL